MPLPPEMWLLGEDVKHSLITLIQIQGRVARLNGTWNQLEVISDVQAKGRPAPCGAGKEPEPDCMTLEEFEDLYGGDEEEEEEE